MSTAAAFQDFKSVQGLPRTLSERGPKLLAGVLIIVLALDGALIVSRALSGPETPPPAAPIALTAATPHSSTNPQLLLATIVNAHLFGAATGATGGANAPPTTMSLILAGVIADVDPSKGQAIIGENAAAAKLYSVNGVIAGGARLHAVYSDRVLIERNGGLETLALPRNALGGAAGVARPAPIPTAAAMRENPSLLAGLVRVQPVFSQGKMNGYRIFPAGPSGTTAFNQLGLRAGDLIVGVNGTTLEDPAHAMEVLQTLSSSGSATITVSRNGVDQEVNLNLATLNSLGSGADSAAAAEPTPGEPAAGPLGLRRRLGAPLGPGQPSDADQRTAPAPPVPLPGRVTGEVNR